MAIFTCEQLVVRSIFPKLQKFIEAATDSTPNCVLILIDEGFKKSQSFNGRCLTSLNQSEQIVDEAQTIQWS